MVKDCGSSAGKDPAHKASVVCAAPSAPATTHAQLPLLLQLRTRLSLHSSSYAPIAPSAPAATLA